MGNWGIKVSKPGFSVTSLDANNENPNLLFTSKYDGLKIALTGSGTFNRGSTATIAHGLGEPKAFIVYLSLDGINYYAYDGRSYIDSTNLVIQKDRETIINDYYPINANDQGTESSSAGYFSGFAKVGFDTSFGDSWKGAFRFRNVTETSSIQSADLRFYISSRTGGTVQVRTWGIDEDNASDFAENPFGRSKTSAVITNSNDGGISAGGYWGYDVTSIFQEITGRGGWSSGNSMGFLIENNGTTGNNYFYDNGDTNSFIRVTKLSPVITVYYKYVIFTHKLDSTKAI